MAGSFRATLVLTMVPSRSSFTIHRLRERRSGFALSRGSALGRGVGASWLGVAAPVVVVAAPVVAAGGELGAAPVVVVAAGGELGAAPVVVVAAPVVVAAGGEGGGVFGVSCVGTTIGPSLLLGFSLATVTGCKGLSGAVCSGAVSAIVLGRGSVAGLGSLAGTSV